MVQAENKAKSLSSLNHATKAIHHHHHHHHHHHIQHDYPLAPEKINIQKEWLCNYCLNIANTDNILIGSVKKFVPNLMNKNNYVIH